MIELWARVLAAALAAVVLSTVPAGAEGRCPGEPPVPWAGPTLYSGGMHFAELDSVTGSIALFRRLNGLPDLEWPEKANFYPTGWFYNPEASGPPVEDRLRWAAESALSGDLSAFEPYRSGNRYEGSTNNPLPAIELDLSTAPGTPLNWWLTPTQSEGWSPRQTAVHRLAKEMELVDWLQTTVTGSHASWVFEWSFVAPIDAAYAEWRAVFDHAYARWQAGDGLEWAAAAFELLPPGQTEASARQAKDHRGVRWFDDVSPTELLALHASLVRKVEACTATPGETAAALALAAPAHAHGAPPALLRPFVTRSPEAAANIAEKGLRRTLLEAQDPKPWLALAAEIEAAHDPDRVTRLGRVARLTRFLTAKSLDEALAVYDKRRLDAEAEHVLNLLPYRTLARLAARKTWTLEDRARLARAAVARAWALGHTQKALALLPLLAATNPDLVPEIMRIQTHRGRTARERALLLLILRTPAINLELAGDTSSVAAPWLVEFYGPPRASVFKIDHMRHSLLNWWCPMRAASVKGEPLRWDIDTLLRLPPAWGAYRTIRGWADWEIGRHEQSRIRSSNRFDLPDDLLANRHAILQGHPLLKAVDAGELQALSRVASAPEALSRSAIQWGKSVGRGNRLRGLDREVPEALYLAVRTTRWGCQTAGGHGAWSRDAFELLHRRWGDTTWAELTPYWFDDSHFWSGYRHLRASNRP
jgi:hypothetical protein